MSRASNQDRMLYENGQYLLEEDPQNPGEITQAAEEAQQAKWRRLMANRPPLKTLPRSKMARGGHCPTLYRFGIPFTRDWMVAYAKRHHLKLELYPEERGRWGGKECLDLGEVDFETLSPKELLNLRTMACHLGMEDINVRCGYVFEHGHPFTMEYDGILSFWSNHNVKTRLKTDVWNPTHFKRIVAEFSKAMSEDGGLGEPMWWFDWNNEVDIFINAK